MLYNQDINFIKGDTIRWSQFVKNSDGTVYNFSGCTLYMSIISGYSKDSPNDSLLTYVQYINDPVPPPTGIIGGLGAELGGTLYMCVGYTYSEKMKTERTGAYEVKVKSPQKDITTVLKGNLYPNQQVTTLQINGVTGNTGATGAAENTYNVYVSNIIGNNSWSGDLSFVSGTCGPVQSLNRAVQYANAYTGTANIEIRVMGGTYRILGTQTNQAFYLDENNFTNSVNRTITIKKAFSNQDVIFRGDERLSYEDFSLITSADSMWAKLSNNPSIRKNIYVADVSGFDLGKLPSHYLAYRWGVLGLKESWGGLPSVPDLIYNNTVMKVSRWPSLSNINSSGYSFEETANIGDKVGDVVVEGTNGYRLANPDTSGVNGIFKYPASYDSVISDWDVNDDITMMLFSRFDWSEEYFKVLSIDKNNRQITVRSKNARVPLANNAICDGGLTYAAPALRRWYVSNVPYDISSGEYYIDRDENKLYFYPPDEFNNTAEICLTHRALSGCGTIYDPVNDTNDAQRGYNDQTGAPATGLTYTFEYPGWTGMNSSIGYTAAGGDIQSRHIHNTKNGILSMFKFFKIKNLILDNLIFKNCAGSAIQMDLCDNITVQNCDISNTKYHGINALGVTNLLVNNCTFTDIGLSGVVVCGGNHQTLESSNNTVTSSVFNRCAMSNPSQSNAILCTGIGHTLSKNLFTNIPGQAIYVIGINNIIEYNHFYSTNTDLEDSGVVYGYNEYHSFGNKIRYNFFNQNGSNLPGATAYKDGVGCTAYQHQIVAGVYLDGYMSGFDIYKNVFYAHKDYGQCIFINGGNRNSVYNNIFINSKSNSTRFEKYTGNVLYNGSVTNPGLIKPYEYSITNPNDYLYYPTGGTAGSGVTAAVGGKGDPRILGYNWWNYYASNYIRDKFSNGIPTLIMTADVRAAPYTTSAPWLSSDLTISGDTITGFSNFNSYKDILVPYYDNVLINHGNTLTTLAVDTPAGPYSNYVGGLSAGKGASYASIASFNGFEDPNNLNFKLTYDGLVNIQTKLPNFQDIPFEQIPTL